jgi:hypothetical protein
VDHQGINAPDFNSFAFFRREPARGAVSPENARVFSLVAFSAGEPASTSPENARVFSLVAFSAANRRPLRRKMLRERPFKYR